jgi:hypothetical protein
MVKFEFKFHLDSNQIELSLENQEKEIEKGGREATSPAAQALSLS